MPNPSTAQPAATTPSAAQPAATTPSTAQPAATYLTPAQRTPAREWLIALADDFQNNFLTLEIFGQYHGLRREEVAVLVDLAQKVRATPHPEQ